MPGKILSSRTTADTDELSETLQEFLFVIRDSLGEDTDDLPDDVDELLLAIDHDLVDLGLSYGELAESATQMAGDLVSLSVANVGLAMELKRAMILLSAMAVQPTDDEIVDRTMALLRREGKAELIMEQDDEPTGLVMNTHVKFDENDLREALKQAIAYYNEELGSKLLGL